MTSKFEKIKYLLYNMKWNLYCFRKNAKIFKNNNIKFHRAMLIAKPLF